MKTYQKPVALAIELHAEQAILALSLPDKEPPTTGSTQPGTTQGKSFAPAPWEN